MMTPAETQKAADDLAKEFLPSGYWISIGVTSGQAHLIAYSSPSCKRVADGRADDWSEAIENLRSALISWRVECDLGLVRKMALSIIDLTDGGICDVDALIKAGFTAEDIARSGTAACAMAAKITSVEAYHIHAGQEAAE